MRANRHTAWIAAFAITAVTVACRPEPTDQDDGNASSNEVQLPRLPVAEPPIDRAALLLAVAKAASAAALRVNDSDAQRELDGKRFEVRIRFGCPGRTDLRAAAPSAAPFGIRFNPGDRTLRIRARPDLRLSEPAVAALGGTAVEAVEGFWMYRPWLLADGCVEQPPSGQAEGTEPNDSDAAEQSPQGPDGQRVGLAQFFTADDARTGRRDERAFETTKVLGAEEQPSPQGYNLVLSGRLRQLPGGRVIACRPIRSDRPPECVVSAAFDRIKIENPVGGTVLAEWTS